jgi:hypothetical protein
MIAEIEAIIGISGPLVTLVEFGLLGIAAKGAYDIFTNAIGNKK